MTPPQLGAIVQVPWTNSYGLGKLLDRGGEKPAEGTEELVSADKYLGTGRIDHAGVGNLIQSGDTDSSFFWVGDVGDEPLNGMGPGVIK